jgi:tRNA threonylcarbamoyladenosine biosynthesis protein TsaE
MQAASNSLADTERLAQEFVSSLNAGSTAVVVGLSGDLGSGKTTFTQSVARALGIQETVTSPTFVIEKIYKLDHKAFDHLIHIDAYRLEKSDELKKLGWDDIVQNPKNLVVIEWPEKVQDILPDGTKILHFKFLNENSREINF